MDQQPGSGQGHDACQFGGGGCYSDVDGDRQVLQGEGQAVTLWVSPIPTEHWDTDRSVIGMFFDFLPGVGDGKGFIEAFSGHDLVTGESLAWWERGLGLIFLSELRGLANAGDAIADGARAVDGSADDLYEALGDDDLYFHYTNDAGLEGIADSGVIRADAKNNVYLSQDMYDPDEAFATLFIGNPRHTGRGDNVIAFEPPRGSLIEVHSDIDFVHVGSVRLDRANVVYAGKNPF